MSPRREHTPQHSGPLWTLFLAVTIAILVFAAAAPAFAIGHYTIGWPR